MKKKILHIVLGAVFVGLTLYFIMPNKNNCITLKVPVYADNFGGCYPNGLVKTSLKVIPEINCLDISVSEDCISNLKMRANNKCGKDFVFDDGTIIYDNSKIESNRSFNVEDEDFIPQEYGKWEKTFYDRNDPKNSYTIYAKNMHTLESLLPIIGVVLLVVILIGSIFIFVKLLKRKNKI